MSTLFFTLLCIGIILSGGLIGVLLHIIVKNKKKILQNFFCNNNGIYCKFVDQIEVSIDEVSKNFELLDI